MEIHLTYALEKGGKQVKNGQSRFPNDKSNIDIMHPSENGVEVRAECMFIQTPDAYWTEREIAPGLNEFSAFHRGAAEFRPSRIAQGKIRLKTIREDGSPTKFPVPESNTVQLIICDITKGLGVDLDYFDLKLLTQGRQTVPGYARRDLLGLFERKNEYGAKFDREFSRNRYLRERIHGILFSDSNVEVLTL